MATIIDALVVSLGLDPSKFTEGQKQAAAALIELRKQSEEQAGKIEAQGEKAAQFFHKVKKAALEFLTVFTAGVGTTEFLKFLTEADTQLGRLADRTGISAQKLGAWGAASRALGGSATATEGTIASLINRFALIAITGDTSIVPWLTKIQGGLKLTGNATLDAQDALLKLADTVAGMSPASRTAYLSGLGLDAGTITLVEQGRGAIERLLATYRKLQPTPADIAAAEQRQRDWTLLDATWVEVGRTLVTQLEPAINALLEALTALASWFARHPFWLDVAAGITGIIVAVSAAALAMAAFGGIIAAIGTAVTAFAGIAISLAPGVAAAFTLMFGPIGIAAAAIAAIIAGIVWLATHTKTALGAENKYGAWVDQMLGLTSKSAAPGGAPSRGAEPGAGAKAEKEAYIVESAKRQGIDPKIALAVARSEGLGGPYAGDRGSSFGPFQLHMGGLAGGGMAGGGLGDTFRKQTGLDPRDPTTWRAQVDWSLGWAKTHGWNAWHGWHGPALAGIGSGATVNNSSASRTVNVNGPTTINTPATDAKGIAADYHAALRRTLAASDANMGFA